MLPILHHTLGKPQCVVPAYVKSQIIHWYCACDGCDARDACDARNVCDVRVMLHVMCDVQCACEVARDVCAVRVMYFLLGNDTSFDEALRDCVTQYSDINVTACKLTSN